VTSFCGIRKCNDRSRWPALYVLCPGVLMIVLDATIVNVALPSIQHDLAFSLDGDPGIRPSAHQFVGYAAAWAPVPEDGLPRFDERIGSHEVEAGELSQAPRAARSNALARLTRDGQWRSFEWAG
jgi:hypothetical protein